MENCLQALILFVARYGWRYVMSTPIPLISAQASKGFEKAAKNQFQPAGNSAFLVAVWSRCHCLIKIMPQPSSWALVRRRMVLTLIERGP